MAGGIGAGRGRCRCRDRGRSGRMRGGRRRRDDGLLYGLGDTDFHAALFVFDLAQAGVVEDTVKLAHHLAVDIRHLGSSLGLWRRRRRFLWLGHFYLAFLTSSAMASTASRYPWAPSPQITPLAARDT